MGTRHTAQQLSLRAGSQVTFPILDISPCDPPAPAFASAPDWEPRGPDGGVSSKWGTQCQRLSREKVGRTSLIYHTLLSYSLTLKNQKF